MRRVIEVPWSARQAIGVFLIAWIALPIIIWGGLSLLSQVLPVAHHWLALIDSSNELASFILVVIDALVALALIAWILKKYQVGWDSVGLRKFSPGKALLLAVGVLLTFLVLVAGAFALVSWLFPHFNANQNQVNEFTSPHSTSAIRMSFLALVVIPPFIEEITFRGFIFPALTKRWGIIGGAVLTSILFAIAHWQLNVSVYTMLLSLLLCFMYYKLRSIWPGIFVHMINNYIAFTAIIHK